MKKEKLLKIISKIKKSDMRPGLRAGLFTGMTVGAATAAFSQSQPGLRTEAGREGAIGGAIMGAASIGALAVGKKYGRVAKVMGARKGSVIFRRIRGRIVKIKVKSNAGQK